MKPLLFAILVLAAPLAAIEPAEVLVVYNSKAEGSQEIAEYYAEIRGVPKDNLLKLATSTEEEITRDEFNKNIWPQVQEFIRKKPSILAIAPCRGVPLKIKEHNREDDVPANKDIQQFIPTRDFASVDGELALARLEKLEIQGAVENPYLNKSEPLTQAIGVLAVSRLDGATVEIATGLVDKAIVAEALVPEGENYLDTGTNNQGYKQRDGEMCKIADAFKTAGIALNHDTRPEVQDLSTFKEPLHYFGWYAGGQQPKGKVRFRTGAVTAHLHSFSAATVRSPNAHWVGPLLCWNCTATYGTVYEPLTVGFPYENIFYDRLLKGFCFGEAGQMANHLLSWQAVFCGDPLYTPYARDWRARKAACRKALAAMLASGGKDDGGANLDGRDKAVLEAAFKVIKRKVGTMVRLQRSDARAATAQFMDLLFFLRGFELESGMADLLSPFKDDLKRQWAEMKAALKASPAETADYEVALETWVGLPIHADLVEYKADLAKAQEKVAEPLVKKAESARKSKKYLDAWQFANRAALHRFAASAAAGAKIRDGLEKDGDTRAKLYEEANKELKKMQTQAKKDLDKGAFEKARAALVGVPEDYPDCNERGPAVELLKQIEAKLPRK